MTNFGKSLKEGLAASKAALVKKKEITAVFDDLGRQVLAATDGKIGVRIGSYRKKRPQPMRPAILAAIGMEHEREYFEQRHLIAFRADQPEPGVPLGDVEVAPTGYPVSLMLPDGVETRAHDRAALEEILGELLAHPTVGLEIQRLIDAEPPKKTG